MVHIRLALRTLFKTPFVTIVAIVSLALGIGANAAILNGCRTCSAGWRDTGCSARTFPTRVRH